MERMKNVDMKIIVLGSSFVGKTSIINRYCNGTFFEDTLSTVGAGFFSHTLIVEDIEVNVTLWDTAGEERFQSIAPSLLRGSNGIILVFDLTQKNTFEDIDAYLDLFHQTCKIDTKQAEPVLLIGNKMDLENQAVSMDTIQTWKSLNNVENYFPVSAKTGENIDIALDKFFTQLAPEIVNEDAPLQIVIASASGNSEKTKCCS